MNAINALLNTDVRKLTELPKKQVELPRLSKLTGTKFEVTLQAIPAELLADITEGHVEYSKNGRVKNADSFGTGLDIVVNGMVEPDLRNKELLKHLGVTTPDDAARKLFLAGELGTLATAITELSGVTSQNDVDNTVKN